MLYTESHNRKQNIIHKQYQTFELFFRKYLKHFLSLSVAKHDLSIYRVTQTSQFLQFAIYLEI